jgi:hypothetical protein
MLEDRTVPSALGNFLLSINPEEGFGPFSLQNQINQVNSDVNVFNANPTNANSLVQLALDAGRLQALSTQLNAENAYYLGLSEAAVPLLDSSHIQAVRAAEGASNAVAVKVTRAANAALDTFYTALVEYLSGAQSASVPSIPGGTSSPSPTPPPPVTESINAAPTTWPASALVGPSESVTVTSSDNTPRTVTVSSSGTDGSFSQQTDVCTNSMITVTDTAPLSAAGTVVTWNVSVTGLPLQTNTTTFV